MIDAFAWVGAVGVLLAILAFAVLLAILVLKG